MVTSFPLIHAETLKEESTLPHFQAENLTNSVEFRFQLELFSEDIYIFAAHLYASLGKFHNLTALRFYFR